MARTVTGVVISDRGDKTIVIAANTRKTHPIYKKQYSVTTKYIAHDENNEAKPGDKVIISETRPISKRKHFKLSKIVETARIQHVEPEAKVRKSTKKDSAAEEQPESSASRKGTALSEEVS